MTGRKLRSRDFNRKAAGGHAVSAAIAALTAWPPCPFPPLAEQVHIVAEVERCISIIQESALQIHANLKRSARLRQCILKQAFEGKLLPHDPNDEPASVLLDRIKAENANTSGIAKPRKTK